MASFTQDILNSPGPPETENSGTSTQIIESRGSPRYLRVDITVLRAYNVPNIKNRFGKKRPFFVTVASQTTKKKTSSVPAEGTTVEWNENVDAFHVQSSSRLVLCLYAARFAGRDILIGTHGMMPLESQSDVPFSLTNSGRSTGQLVTLHLTVTVSTNMTSHPGSTVAAGIKTLSYSKDFPSEITASVPPATDGSAGTSPAKNALRNADEAMMTIKLSNTWESALERIRWVMDTVSSVAELHPYAKMAYGLIFAIPKTLLEQFQRDDNIRTLLVAMHDAFDFTSQDHAFKAIGRESKQAHILTLMLQHVCNCCDFIRSYAKDSQLWKRMLKNTSGQVNTRIGDFRTVLLELRKEFLDLATIATEITAFQILDDVGIVSTKVDWISTQLQWVSDQVSDAEIDAKIREIPYRTGSSFAPEKGCHPGTRVAFLDFIVNWVDNSDSERGLILFGQAGTGKSSIAHEIARRFHTMHRLTSSFMFVREEQSNRKAYHLFTTLARDLSDRYPSFRAALGRVIRDNSSLRVGTRDYPTLFQSLVLEPLKDLHIVGPILVVIDALDESGDVASGNGLHKFLAKNLYRLPSNFRVLITSRLEDGIESAFIGAPLVRIKYMDDLELAAKTHDDILTFLCTTLLTEELNHYCEALATKAEGLFQWAAVARGYILDPPEFFDFSRVKCIEHLLRSTEDRDRPDPLDELYDEVLKGYFRHQGAQRLFRSVMGQLIAAFEPLSIRSLIALRQRASIGDNSDPESVSRMLRRLSSLLSNVNSFDQTLPIVPLHTSFRDFLTNEEKSGDFYVDLDHSHHRLAYSCLDLVLRDLKFNICNLESSYLANSDVQDLKSRITEHISPTLLYACRYWNDHLNHLDFEADLFDKLRAFFDKNFLFWLEVLSLASSVRVALPALSSLDAWLVSGQGVSHMELERMRAFINDASAFVRYFGIAIAKSAPHIYISALPFAPTRSLVSARYSSSFHRILRMERGQMSHWPSSEMVIPNVGGQVSSIALSLDGQRIISGSEDGIIRMWNATTGETVAGPFTGHTNWVTSVAFSPDDQRIVSGSIDRVVCVWNATTGEMEAGPFSGHAGSVTSVTFSPDGQHVVVSGSNDCTIRVWNATTGENVSGPFAGHTDRVISVAFSPDGQCIVSGSNDRTIRVWNVMTGENVAGPCTGHTGPVTSVAFSPDGQRIVSASSDRTIRMWDVATGENVADPFTGHTDWVTSVAFSRDGERIVSGSSDRTLRVWNAMTGEIMAGPLTGHTNRVTSVAFLPDGRRIVSGSNDRTIRVWNATTGANVARPFPGHRDWVRSVSFSPDGQRVVSGSNDQTIHVWNAATGENIAGPFSGHTGPVTSVAFSPDGQCVVSASSDRTIRVWNVTTGEDVAGPFTGHTGMGRVTSVAFSPDGQFIASGSDNRTIRVWNARTADNVAGPFVGHADSVTSLAFSPDGKRIVSASFDRTIIVWNATTGENVAGPFSGHTDSVRSVAFFPDGQRIISGSNDGTIRVWSATTGENVAGLFTGHTDSVRSVALSPDGKRVVSGSYDGTIRVWNTTTGENVAGPFTGHTNWITSVAFSPDGQRIVSSGYGSIRMLDVTADNLKTETTGQVDFTDQSKINDEGWILGSNDELLMWIPPVHRGNLHRPSNIWVVGEHETRLDLSTFVCGHSWSTCINS